MGHSTLSTKPAKPCPDFPLFPHRTNRWCKKIKGKSHYFGSVTADPNGEAALQLWLDQKDDLLGGRAPRSRTGAVAIRDVCNGFLNFKRRQLESGDICQWTFNEYEATCARIVKVLGAGTEVDSLMPEDFGKLRLNIAKQWGPVRLGNEIGRVKTVFNYAVDPDADLLDRLPRYGKEFKKPSAKTLRIARRNAGSGCSSRKSCERSLPPLPSTSRQCACWPRMPGLGMRTARASLSMPWISSADG